jgi:hypothetical protein
MNPGSVGRRRASLGPIHPFEPTGGCGLCLRSMLAFVALAAIVAVLLPAPAAQACFDLEPVTPAERGAATHLAVGMVDRAGRARRGNEGDRLSIACYGFKPFGLDEVDFGAVTVSVPLDLPVHRINLSYMRLKAFSYVEETYETSWLISTRGLGCLPAVRLGTARLDGDLLGWTVLIDLAFEARPATGTRISIDLTNPAGLGLRKGNGTCPTVISVGLGYLVTPRIAWGGAVRKQGGHETSVAMGFEWAILDRLDLRAGLKTYPEQFSVGTGLCLGGCTVDIATSVNLEVGTTHEFGVACAW